MKSNDLDKTPDDCLYLLKTNELIKIYNDRKYSADMVLGQLMMRHTFDGYLKDQNNRLIFLLQEAMKVIPDNKENEDLRYKINGVLEDYYE